MISHESFDKLRVSLSVKAKNGVNFILAASIVWAIIAFVWTLRYPPYTKSIFTFMVGALLLPLAFLFSKLFKTVWKDEGNPLDPLGLWLNFAQLFYFPFLVFSLIRFPEYFVMVYAIITGAHFFPYAWFYRTLLYAVFAGIISVGAMLLGLFLEPDQMYIIPLSVSILLLFLTLLLFLDSRRKQLTINNS